MVQIQIQVLIDLIAPSNKKGKVHHAEVGSGRRQVSNEIMKENRLPQQDLWPYR